MVQDKKSKIYIAIFIIAIFIFAGVVYFSVSTLRLEEKLPLSFQEVSKDMLKRFTAPGEGESVLEETIERFTAPEEKIPAVSGNMLKRFTAPQ